MLQVIPDQDVIASDEAIQDCNGQRLVVRADPCIRNIPKKRRQAGVNFIA